MKILTHSLSYESSQTPTCNLLDLVAEWIHFTRFGIILPTIKLKVYTFGGL